MWESPETTAPESTAPETIATETSGTESPNPQLQNPQSWFEATESPKRRRGEHDSIGVGARAHVVQMCRTIYSITHSAWKGDAMSKNLSASEKELTWSKCE